MIRLVLVIMLGFLVVSGGVFLVMSYTRCVGASYEFCHSDIAAHAVFYGVVFSVQVGLVGVLRRIRLLGDGVVKAITASEYLAGFAVLSWGALNSGSGFLFVFDFEFLALFLALALQIYLNWYVDRERGSPKAS